MKNPAALRWLLAGALLPGGALAAAGAQETPLPALTGRVVDEAGMLAPEARTRLEQGLARLEAETSVQLVVVTVPRIEGAIEDFTLRLAEVWRIGQAATDNGALLLVSREDREARIEVGYGLEPVIPDGLAGQILREELAPAFAAGDFEGGFFAAAAALARAAAGEYAGAGTGTTGARERAPRRGRLPVWPLVLLLGLLGWIGALNRLLSAGLGAVLGGLAAALFLGFFHLLWLVPLGFVLGIVAPGIMAGASRSHGGMIGGGGVPLHGQGFAGGFSGGGFSGGFSGGGGAFGGGGASGSW